MAKIRISIEDSPDGTVKIESNPTAESMIMRINSGEGATSAHGYAMLMLRTAREESKRRGPTKILIPRIGRA